MYGRAAFLDAGQKSVCRTQSTKPTNNESIQFIRFISKSHSIFVDPAAPAHPNPSLRSLLHFIFSKMVFSCCRCIIKLILSLAIIVGLILAAIFIGAAVQKGQAKKAPDITPKYQTASVCAFSYSNSTSLVFQTYASDAKAIAANATVGQCGDCGQCSNLQDYQVFATKNATALYEDIGYCGLRAAAGSSYVKSCLKSSNYNFTTGCNSCLANYVTCGFKKCGFSCVAAAILNQPWLSKINNGKVNITTTTLNDCLYCTDQLCAPSLLACAGANNQRLNLPSLTGFNKNQYCNSTTVDWTTYKYS